MKRMAALLTTFVMISAMVEVGWGQTNPTAQSLPYSQNFGTSTFTLMPTGTAAWNGLEGSTINSQTLAETSSPTGDATVQAATGTTTTGGSYGYSKDSNGRYYIQTSSNPTNGVNQLACAIITTGKTEIKVSYDVEMINAQPRTIGVVLQYRIGTSGSWTTVSGSVYSHNSSDRTNGSVDSYSSLSLPSAADNQSVVQLRWAVWRGTETGNSSGIAIDNIYVSASDMVSPAIMVSQSSLSGFSYVEGSGPSSSQTYNLSGTNLTPSSGNLTVTGSTNYEVSTDNSTFSSSVNVGYTGGALSETPIYVRLKAGLSAGSYNGEIIANSGGGATTVNVTCSGLVLKLEPTNHVTGFAAAAGSPSYSAITLTWTDATGGTVPDGYLIKGSATSYDAISAPIDGTAESDGALVKNVAQGVQTVTMSGLNENTTYYFKIFPYTNSGANINYKTDGTIPTASLTTGSAPANTLLEENFAFSGYLNSNGWSVHSGSGSNPINTTTGLTYSGYPSSGIGNAALIGNGGGEDVNQGFAEQNTNGQSIYVSFLVNINDESSSKDGDCFLHIGDRVSSTSFTLFAARVFARIVSNNVNFGISNTSTATYGSTNFSKNTTYLLVIKYTINTSGNDEVKLWVFSSGVPETETAAGTPEVTNTSTAGQDVIDAIGLRQGSSTTQPQLIVDGIRIGNTWAATLGPTTITHSISVGSNINQEFTMTNVVLNFGSVSTGANVSVKKYSTAPSNVSFSGTAPTYYSHYRWVIDASGLAFSDGVIKIAVSGLSGIGNPSTVNIYKRSTPGTGAFEKLETSYADGYLSASVSSFSEFILGSDDSDNSLPISLTSFTAQTSGGAVVLTWTTESEIENQGFNIYRKLLGGEYGLLASFVTEPALRGAGSSSEAHSYSYTDKSVQPGLTYTYLLSDVSYAGVEKKHTEKAVTVALPAGITQVAAKYRLDNIYPNPFNPSFTLPLTLGEAQPVEIAVYDGRGAMVRTLQRETLSAGSYQLHYTLNDLGSGVYFLKIKVGGNTEMRKIVLMK